jgi:hypothetical protein
MFFFEICGCATAIIQVFEPKASPPGPEVGFCWAPDTIFFEICGCATAIIQVFEPKASPPGPEVGFCWAPDTRRPEAQALKPSTIRAIVMI